MKTSTARQFMIFALSAIPFAAIAETFENFNSRSGIPIHNIKSSLQNSCWTFNHFDINYNGWNPGIEGDGAMVANSAAGQFTNSGIYTPLLNVSSELTVSFDYTFNENFSGSDRRSIKLCLATANNQIVKVLEYIELDGVNAKLLKKYSTGFHNLTPGEYRLVLQYAESGGTSRIAIDELKISAPFKYSGGCNNAPIAVKDKLTGMSNRSASGSLLLNDKDPNHESLNAYLIKGSPHGKVTLNEDGSFIFTPNEDFKGNSTNFTYRICDEGAVNLCSENTTVHISFPVKASPALSLVDFKGSYKFNGNVELVWSTIKENDAARFEIERSFDGQKWENSGMVATKNPGTNSNHYTYTDKVSRNKAFKNDLFYRLKQVDEDGSSAMSRLLLVRVYNTRSLTMISVTPNPEMNDIAVNVQLQERCYVSMRVLDGKGSTVLYSSRDAEKGLNNFTVSGSSKLKPGNYMLEVIVNSSERMLVKLLKE